MMTVTIHVGQNAFFLDSIVPVEENEDPESAEPQTQEWSELAGPGGAVGAPPQRARRRRRQGLGRLHRRVIRKHATLLEAVRTAVEGLPEEAPPSAGPGLPTYRGDGDPLGKCSERLKVSRLDEGYVVTHRKPIDKKKIEEVVAGSTKDSTKVAKKAELFDTIMRGVFETIGRGGATGPTEVFGFDTVDEVVEFVGLVTTASEPA